MMTGVMAMTIRHGVYAIKNMWIGFGIYAKQGPARMLRYIKPSYTELQKPFAPSYPFHTPQPREAYLFEKPKALSS